MKKIVIIPNWLKNGIRPIKNSFPKKLNLIVFDTETESEETGDPYLLIFYDGLNTNYIRVTPKTVAIEFMRYLLDHCPKKKSNILFAHNLEFDLGAILCYNTYDIFRWKKPPPIKVKNLGEIRVFPQKTWFAQIKMSNKANVKVVDSGNFIRGSLHDISRELNLKHKKETKPKWLGRKPRNKKEWKELIRYCRPEIKAEYDLAQYILGIHKRYNVGYTVSVAQLGSKIFRKHFLESSIPQSPYPVRMLAEFCIHGGRAECFIPHPTVISKVKMFDYNSFYPWAMIRLPPLTKGDWIKVKEFSDSYEGFYRVSGYVSDCKWPLVLKSASGFSFAKGEYVKNIPVVSYELREAVNSNEIELDEVEGWIWIPSENSVNPFKDFVEEFYRLKESHRQDIARARIFNTN